MELRHLRYFIAVAEELHFGRAAKRLHVSQPPLSQQIRDLEAQLDVRLFERSSRTVTLTPAGAALLPRARELFRQIDAAVAHAQRSARGDVGALAVGFSSAAVMGPLPVALRAFRAQHPAIALDLTEMNSPSLVRALQAEQIDVALIAAADAGRGAEAADDAVASRPVSRDTLGVALPARHRLARLSRIPLARLADEPRIVLRADLEPAWSREMTRVLDRHNVRGPIVLETDSKLSLLALVAAGMGVAIVSASLATHRTKGVVFRPVASAPVDLTVAVAWRRDDRSPLVQQFVAACPRP